MIATSLKPYTRESGSGFSALYTGQPITFLATGEDTNDQFGLIDVFCVAGTEPPPHTHETEDECFYILEGSMSFFVDGQELPVSQGGWAFVPRQTLHTFKVTSGTARTLIFFTPAGFERFFMEMSEPAPAEGSGPAPEYVLDIPRLLATAAKYNCIFQAPTS